MGEVRVLPVAVTGVRLADAITAFLATIGPANTRRSYAAALNRMCKDFSVDADTARLDPDRVAGWFTFVWGQSSPQTFNVRLAGLRKAFEYWREQGWLVDDPLSRLHTRPIARDDSRALTRAEIAGLFGLNVPLRERVLWQLLYETAARVEELLMLDVPHLDTANRLAVVIRKGGAKDVVVWQTGTARLLPRVLAGRRSGPVFLTDRRAPPSVATLDVDPTTGRARLSYRRAAELFECHTAALNRGPFTLHQLRHSALTHAAEDGASTPILMKLSGHTSVRSLTKYARPSVEALARWRAQTDPATRGHR